QQLPDAGLRPQQFQALLEVSESITRHGDLAELFHDLAQRLRRVVPFDFISVLLHDDATDMMRQHILTSDGPRVRTGPGTHPPDSPGGRVWATQQPMVVPDYEQETRFPKLIPVWRELGMRSGCYLPLTTARRRLGAINFASARPRTYDPGDLWLFEQVARQAA